MFLREMMIRIQHFYLLLTLLPSIAYPMSVEPYQDVRVALVMGNASYKNGALRNPVNDARAVAEQLEKLGFKVLLRENLNREAMHQSINEFGKALKKGGVGLFYYAGHGMQIKGKNFLIPIDEEIQSEDDIEFRGIDANFVVSRMAAANNRVNLLVLDACRNNPFARNNRSGNLGLAQMDAPKGTLIAFSTAPGSLAKDGDGANSVYTKYLIEYLVIPALPVERVFKEVRVAVDKETNGKQIPWESSSLMGEFYFSPPITLPKLIAQKEIKLAKIEVATSIQTRTQAVSEPVAAFTAPEEKAAKYQPAQHGRNYEREGYEIELRAKSLTSDQIFGLEKKAEGGDAVAQTTLGWAYLLGKGQIDGRNIPRNNTKMIYWTRLAAKQGYPVAQNNLGAIYMEATGTELDYKKAQHYFKLAADQGYITAQRNLFQLNTMLTGKPDMESFKGLVNKIQQQITTPVK